VTSWLRGFSSLDIRLPYRGSRALLVALAGLTALGTLSGCSIKARDMLSAASVEAKIAAQLVDSYDVPPPRVYCPAAVPAQVGSRFTCTTELDGQPLTVSGEVAGPRGSVSVRPETAVIVMASARVQISRDLARTFGVAVEVSCSAPALLVARPGRTFDCSADVGGIQLQVAVTVTSSAGTLSPRVLPYRPT
jgi:hypothetical protein